MREFSQVEVELVAKEPGTWKLYLAGLERSDDLSIQREGKEVWLPAGRRIKLSGYADDEPWIPGYYDVQVRCGQKRYYNLLYVCPKGMTTGQLDLMRQEIEDLAAGLAMDVVGSNRANMSAADYYRLQLLWQNFPRLCAAVTDIIQRPSQQVTRSWQVVPFPCAKRITKQSISWLGKHPQAMAADGPSFILSGKGTVLYDLPENRWLADALDQIIACLQQIAAAADKDSRKCAQHMQEQLRALRRRPPLGHLAGQSEGWSLTMFKDGRYRLLYELWRQLFKPGAVHFRGQLGWKRTDLLFEYWCFLRLITALQELGFSLSGGTLLEGQLAKEGAVVSLKPGTKVELASGEKTVVVTYDETLPHTAAEARGRGQFLMVFSPHDRPDLRLDFYRRGQYSYTAIMDAKYRHPSRIWDRRVLTGERVKWPAAMEQISAYKYSVSAIDQPNVRCVREAALICPPVGQPHLDYDSDSRLALVTAGPGGGAALKEYLAGKVIA